MMKSFMKKWEDSLNRDIQLKRRIQHRKSTTTIGKELFYLEIEKRETIRVVLQRDTTFQLDGNRAEKPLLSWYTPCRILKQVLLGQERMLYGLLDERCRLSFDTEHFTHWNGVTALAVFLNARELIKKDAKARQVIEDL